jgi:hypothetical protein
MMGTTKLLIDHGLVGFDGLSARLAGADCIALFLRVFERSSLMLTQSGNLSSRTIKLKFLRCLHLPHLEAVSSPQSVVRWHQHYFVCEYTWVYDAHCSMIWAET